MDVTCQVFHINKHDYIISGSFLQHVLRFIQYTRHAEGYQPASQNMPSIYETFSLTLFPPHINTAIYYTFSLT